jgi:hypothetical protein
MPIYHGAIMKANQTGEIKTAPLRHENLIKLQHTTVREVAPESKIALPYAPLPSPFNHFRVLTQPSHTLDSLISGLQRYKFRYNNCIVRD